MCCCIICKHAYVAAAKSVTLCTTGTKLRAQELRAISAGQVCEPHITQQFAVATSLPLTASRT